MKIKVNGKLEELVSGATVSVILAELKVEQPDLVSVQINGEYVEREQFESTIVKEGDEVDFLYFMGGG